MLGGSAWEHHDDRPYSPVSLCAATKGALHAIPQWYTEASGVRAVTLDLSDMYGPDDPRRKLVTVLHDAIASGEPVSMNDRRPIIDLLHVRDAARAFLIAAMRAGHLAAGTRERWAVRGGAPITLRELVCTIEEVAGRRLDVRWGTRPHRAREALSPWTSGSPLPGWRAAVTLRQGPAELLDGARSLADS